ncbi:MAG: hypothetical protein RDU76_04265 [Candidatus Edwardsbacteria bacterium]|nr:hypothetical protein [Candidatus Edwardsbacteria bacterium]
MKKNWLLAVFPGALALMAISLVVALLIVKILWAWTIPDLFPGAVEQGLVVKSISWLTSLKVAILVVVFAGIAGVRKDRG